MRIGVNAVPLRVSGGGARFVFTELMERLLTLDHRNEYVIFAHLLGLGVVNQIPAVHRRLRTDGSTARVRVVEVAGEHELFRHRDQFDLFFGPLNNLQPRLYDRPSVAILHDIQEQFFPEYFSEGDLLARREIYPEICRSVTTLITISEFCKQSIVEKFGIEPDKIEVVYNAPQSGLVDRDADDPGRWRREPLTAGYFFYPANRYPHKNHVLLLDALVALRRAGRDVRAVFTGYDWPGGVQLPTEIARRGLSDHCRVYDEVTVDELRYLYRHAAALAMPSRFEGFGLPLVEALACGCPAVCADLPSLREIAGEHALYFDPTSAASLQARLEQILDDAAIRATLLDGGREAARRFSWDFSARRLIEVFHSAPQRFHGVATDARRSARRDEPRIGVVVSARDASDAHDAIKSILNSGYGNAVIRVATDSSSATELASFLAPAEIHCHPLAAGESVDWPLLAHFVEEADLDIVGEIAAGSGRLLASALHSLASALDEASRMDPPPALLLGEAWEERGGDVEAVARLRQLGDGLWKLEGFLHPEMLFFTRSGMAQWTDAADFAAASGRDWRWALLKAARTSGRLFLMRRSLAVCDTSRISPADRYRAMRSGIESLHRPDGSAAPLSWLTRLKPVLKPASRVLPTSLRDKGKRIWRHLTNA